MGFCRACLVALLLAFSCVLGSVGARAANLDEALAHFTTDDFSETITGINDVAASGNPRALTIIRALQDGRLMYSAESKVVYIKDDTGELTDAATGKPISGEAPADVDTVRLNNRLRGAIEAALGGLTLLAENANARYEAAQAVFKSRQVGALPALEAALAKEQDPGVKRVMTEARAAIILSGNKASDEEKLAAVEVIRQRADQDALGLLSSLPADTAAPVAKSAAAATAGDQKSPGALGGGTERLVRHFSRFGPAARRHRSRDHLRRHGRHQHGARRDGHAGRLRHVCRAGGDPQQQSGVVRLLAGDRHSACLSSSPALSAS